MDERRKGYEELTDSIFVSDEDAFDYALEHCLEDVPLGIRSLKWTKEFREMLVEWFYSGNWIRIP